MPVTQDSRILIKRSTTTGVVPTIPASSDHTDGTWLVTDIYKGEIFINLVDGKVWTRDDSGILLIFSSGSPVSDLYKKDGNAFGSAAALGLTDGQALTIKNGTAGAEIIIDSLELNINHGDYIGMATPGNIGISGANIDLVGLAQIIIQAATELSLYSNNINLISTSQTAIEAGTDIVLQPTGNIKLPTLTPSRSLGLDASGNIIAEPYTILRNRIAISSAQILNMNSSPIVLVPAPGVGYAIDVISIAVEYVFGTIAYATNINLVVQSNHVTPLAIGSNNLILPSSVDRFGAIVKVGISGVAANQYQENTAIQLITQTGNPTAGDGSMIVHITYGIITL